MVRHTQTVTATAPAKAILLGEHAVNRGQMALAVSVGLYATCTLQVRESAAAEYRFTGGDQQQTTTRTEILNLGQAIDGCRAGENYAAIQQLASRDFFAPAKYVLAAAGEVLPRSLHIRFTSTIPRSAGLGSGGACFVASATALAEVIEHAVVPRQIAAWAQRGDIVAHGGVASGLDTQTSLYGGAIRYTATHEGEPIPYAGDLTLVIGNTGVIATTSTVNGRVRAWLEERPVRMHYFEEIGLLARLAEQTLREGDWPQLGHLLNLNQLLLERIGVSSPELETLIDASLAAGALGAKLSGSGGGGIMIALVTPATVESVGQAIEQAGGTAIVAPVGVPGARLESGGVGPADGKMLEGTAYMPSVHPPSPTSAGLDTGERSAPRSGPT